MAAENYHENIIPAVNYYPSKQDDIILRQRLFSELEKNSAKKLIAVTAPAGYGKTSLISSYLYENNYPFAWLNAGLFGNDFFVFIRQLVSCFRHLKNGFGTKLLSMAETAGSSSELASGTLALTRDFAAVFINELAIHFDDKIYFVIDDFHSHKTAENDFAVIFLNHLIESGPPKLKFIITSRNEIPLNITVLKAKRNYFEITLDDLKFSDNELDELISKFYEDKTRPVLINFFNSLFEGWITGIHLAFQSGVTSAGSAGVNQNAVNEQLYDFFMHEIWKSLDAELRGFLLKTSLLENFTAGMVESVFGIKDCDKYVNLLIKQNIFINKNNSETPQGVVETYHYNTSFKEFLQKKLFEESEADVIPSYFKSIAKYYNSIKEFIPAINYFTKAKEFDKAAGIIKSNFNEILNRGDYSFLEKCCKMLPEKILFGDPELLYVYAKIILYTRNDYSKVIELMDDSLKILNRDKNKIPFLILKAEALITANKAGETVSLFQDAALNNPQIHFILGRVYYRKGFDNYEKATKHFDLALSLCDENTERQLKADICRFLGHIYHDKGEWQKALFYRKNSITYCTNPYNLFIAHNNMITLLSVIGKFAEAGLQMKELEKIYAKYPFAAMKRLMFKSKQFLYYEVSDYTSCIDACDELIKLEGEQNILNFMWLNYTFRGLSNYYTGKNPDAKEDFELAESFLTQNDNMARLNVNLAKALLLMRVDLHKNRDEIESSLTDIYKYYKDSGSESLAAEISFFMAKLYFGLKNYETALLHLKPVFLLVKERQTFAFFEHEFLNSRELFDFAVSLNLGKTVIKDTIRNIRSKTDYDWLTANFHSRLNQDISKLTDISLVSLGSVDIYLRGGIINEDKWIRKKSKIILAYLLANEGIVLTKDKAIDMFFPELPADKAEVALHSTVYNIRTAVKIYDISKDKSKKSGGGNKEYDYNPQFIIYEDKMLRLNKEFFYEADNVKFEKLYHKVKLPSIEKEEKIKLCAEAIELYKGEFLPGNYESWCEEKRIDYKNMFIGMCEELAEILESEKRYDESIKYAARLIAEDNINETGHLCLICSYAAMGNVNMARDRFSLMLKIFDEELGEKPSAETLKKIKEALS